MTPVRLLKKFLFGALSVPIFLFSQCKGEDPGTRLPTSVSGQIFDSRTGAPIDGASVYLSAKDEDYYAITEDYTQTNSNGRFDLSIVSVNPAHLGLSVHKQGYVYPQFTGKIEWGNANEIAVQMTPLDAYVAITAKNIHNQSGKLYYMFDQSPGYCYPWPLLIPFGDSTTSVFKIVGGGYLKIKWGFHDKLYYPGLSFVDSVYCVHDDTTYYRLNF